MNIHRLSHGRWPSPWLFGLLLFVPLAAFTGCQNDDITTYQAPRAKIPSVSFDRKRLIAVIFPQDDKMWVVKLLGQEKQVEPLVVDFDKIVDSVNLTKDEAKPIVWKLPAGWSEEPGNKDRFATLKSPGDDPLEVTVSLPLPKSPLLDNVVRWRRQVGLMSPITEEQAELFAKRGKVNGVDTLRVDLLGPVMTSAHAAPPPMPGLAEKPDKPIQYKTPEGWKELPSGQFSLASFAVQSGDDKASVTVTPLPGKAGSILQNVNRWREQVMLKPIDEEQLKKDLKDDKVGGVEAVYVKLVGEKQSILGFVLKRGDEMWFFKMSGPKNLVEKQETTFKDFCHSIEFK